MNTTQAKRIVVKVGSSLVTNNGEGLDHAAIGLWAEQMASLLKAGHEVLMVSSGAIAEGMQRLGWTKRPHINSCSNIQKSKDQLHADAFPAYRFKSMRTL